jgi:hypothetical protein
MDKQIGDYVVYSKTANVAPFFVKMAGDDTPLSTHWDIREARNRARLYGVGDRRRRER